MTPIDAAEAEVRAEFAALRAMIGSGRMPDAITIRVETDRQTGMPRHVDLQPEWRRDLRGGAVAARRIS